MTEATIFAKPLPAGGTIGVSAPASPQDARSEVLRGVDWWESKGYRVKLAEGTYDRDDYVAGEPRRRGEDLTALFADPDVDVVQTLQGGYGSAQTIPHIDFDVVKQNPKPDGKVVLGNDIPSLQLLVQRLNGVQNVLRAKLPNLKIVGPVDTKSEPTSNTVAWRSFVQANQDAIGFIGVGSQDGVALPLIAKQTGRSYLAGSADLPPEAMQAVKDGDVLFALSSPEHWMKGYIAMHLLIEAKRKCKPVPEGWWNSGNLLVEKSNVDQIIARQQSPEARKAWFKPEIDRQLTNPPLAPLDQAN